MVHTLAQHEGIQFERPIGAPADVQELEYLSALHQTGREDIRPNATVSSKDIRNYLTSRHGVHALPKVLQERIISELCGTIISDDDKHKAADEQPMMDLCQMVGLLLIPYLRGEDIEESKKGNNSLIRGMAEQVLKLILEELETRKIDLTQFKAVDENFETGTRITRKLLQCMFEAYGEHQVPRDILEEMVKQAAVVKPKMDEEDEDLEASSPILLKTRRKTRGDDLPLVMLTKDSFLRALTADVQLYNPAVEHSVTTSHLEDAKHATTTAKSHNHNNVDDNGEEINDTIKFNDNFYTAPMIDQSAEQYKSIMWMMLLWITFLLYYICYIYDSDAVISFDNCNLQFGCDVAAAIVNWLIVFAQIGICGFLYITLGSGGNAAASSELASAKVLQAVQIIVAMGVVVCATIVPNFVQGEAFIWNSIKPEGGGWEAIYWFCFVLGCMLLCLQFLRLIDVFAGPLGGVGVGGRGRAEQASKLAATKKVNVLVENAMLMHVSPVLAGQQIKAAGGGWKFPAKHTSPEVIRDAAQLHRDHDADMSNKKKQHKYREGGNIEMLTRGEGSERAKTLYMLMREATETAGGVVWAYLRMADGRLFDEEGIWLSARLITANFAQWLVVVAVVIFYFVAVAWFDETKATSVAVGQQRRLGVIMTNDAPQLVMKEQHHGWDPFGGQTQAHWHGNQSLAARQHRHQQRRHLQYIEEFNSTHYTDGTGVYQNIIYDLNSTHFTDGSGNFWPHNIFSHNGTHVFDNYFQYNSTHFSDGTRLYPYAQFATNGTHVTNGEYIFDGTAITPLDNNELVASVESWQFQTAAGIGLAAAVVATIGIAVVYIPSFVSTVLKFRSGILASLKGGESFQALRSKPQQVTTLLGNAIWGAVYTGLLAYLFAGGIAFLSVWSETQDFASNLYALFIGFHAILLIYFVVTRLFRELYVSSLYRKHPAAMNFINVLLESWNLVLAVGNMWYRSMKLLAVTIFYIGRIDVPMTSPGVGYVGPYALDSEHFDFKRDLLIHEAHRHPFMERLGMMYLMKIHHGREFGSRAGAYWRLLFVLALMPWMAEYRVRTNQEDNDSDSDSDSDSDDDSADGAGAKDDNSVMSLHGMDLEIDVTRRANEKLSQRNRDLKLEIENLRKRLRDANTSVAKLERRAGRSGSYEPGPTSVEGGQQPTDSASGSEELDSFMNESTSENNHNPPGPVSVKGSDRGSFKDDFSSTDANSAEVGRRPSHSGLVSVESSKKEADNPSKASDDAKVVTVESGDESFESESESNTRPGSASVKQDNDANKDPAPVKKGDDDDESFASEPFDDEFSSEDSVDGYESKEIFLMTRKPQPAPRLLK